MCKILQKTFVNLIQIYSFWRLKDHWLCQPPTLSAAIITHNLGMNIFSSSQPLDKLPIPIFGEIILFNNTESFGSQRPSQHILWMKWWLTLKSSYLYGLFLTSIIHQLTTQNLKWLLKSGVIWSQWPPGCYFQCCCILYIFIRSIYLKNVKYNLKLVLAFFI